MVFGLALSSPAQATASLTESDAFVGHVMKFCVESPHNTSIERRLRVGFCYCYAGYMADHINLAGSSKQTSAVIDQARSACLGELAPPAK
jgi:hypothetical protein